MIINGLQKLTLLDYPSKTACIVFVNGCNFRCPFCHNASLALGQNQEKISEENFFNFLNARHSVLEGVCITGGEPTLQLDLESFITKIKDLGFCVKLDTNGYRPDVLKNLCQKGLIDYIAMDIKNSPAKYSLTTGIKGIDIMKIKESASFLFKFATKPPVERVDVVAGSGRAARPA